MAGHFLQVMKAENLSVSSTDGIQLHGWMVTELHLTDGELFAFALVHQLSQSRAGVYFGNTYYLASWLGCSERTARRYLASLEKKGLIAADRGRTNGKDYCHYRVAEGVTNFHPKGGQNDTPRGDKNDKGGVTKLHPDNTRIDNTSVFIPPTPPEVADYVRKFGMADPDGFAIYYVEQMTNNGWTYGKKGTPVKNWKNNVQQWLKYHKNEDFSFLKPSGTPTQKPAPSALNPDTYQKIFE